VIQRSESGHESKGSNGLSEALTSSILLHRPGAAAAQGGAAAARRLRELVDAHFTFVWRSLRRAGVSEADADDATQRVFLTVSRRLAEIRPGAEKAFIYSVVQGEAGHLRRSYQRRGEVGAEQIEDRSTGRPRPDELAGRRQALQHVRAVLGAMDEVLRSVFVLFEIEEMSCQEIARTLGIPLGTVKSRLQRAREDFTARISEAKLAGSSR
jgi:RNA polymerase sigma-70 factor (ECF subfamily)